MKKYWIFINITLIIIALSFFIYGTSNTVSGQSVDMYKSASCGCCVGHAGYLEGKGFDVNVMPTVDMSVIKNMHNIPVNMRSCHTEIIDGYFVEGHVPMEAINKMLTEKPDIDGISLPNMPSGSPGMPGYKQGEWIIYAIKDGQASEYMRI